MTDAWADRLLDELAEWSIKQSLDLIRAAVEAPSVASLERLYADIYAPSLLGDWIVTAATEVDVLERLDDLLVTLESAGTVDWVEIAVTREEIAERLAALGAR